MTSTKIDCSFNKVAKLQDLADMAELLFPNNRNQQHAFLVVWLAIKWSPHRLVPNLQFVATQHGISRRTLERVRAKMRRLGLIDHVSRFNKAYACREGWILSGRFERSLRELAERVAGLKAQKQSSRDKDEMMLGFARDHRRSPRVTQPARSANIIEGGDL
ncbi:MAG: hypothetical protein IT423_03175 [Pirellulaceae bacterium]|nr:hypothetical protein [Pirellulaceae bacterium]